MNDLIIYGLLSSLIGSSFVWGAWTEYKARSSKGYGLSAAIGITLLALGAPLLLVGVGLEVVRQLA